MNFEEGMHGFIVLTMLQDIYRSDGGIKCMCLNFMCIKIKNYEETNVI